MSTQISKNRIFKTRCENSAPLHVKRRRKHKIIPKMPAMRKDAKRSENLFFFRKLKQKIMRNGLRFASISYIETSIGIEHRIANSINVS
jgi:hypothetical protein